MSVKRLLQLAAVLSVAGLFSLTTNAEQRSMLDGTVEAAEVSRVDMVTNSSGELIQIRVEGCETCRSQSYLPSRDLSVSIAGQPVETGGFSGLSGRAGTLIVNAGSEMVERVDFWVERGGVGADQ